jgi:flagellar hook-associated protein 1 FlgK
MTNFFSGIHRASDAMNAARYGLEVTGQNIANADTPGYTRQASRQQAVGASGGISTLHTGVIDKGGVRVTGTDRLTDPVLVARLRTEHGRSAVSDATAAHLADVESIFKEPSDNGLAEQLHDYWNAWGDVANAPGNPVPRKMLIQQGKTVATSLHGLNDSLETVAASAAESLDNTVSQANSALKELTELNTHIAIAHETGTNPNSLLDRRDELLDELSSAVGGTSALRDNGTVGSVTIGGQDIDLDDLAGTPIETAQDGDGRFDVTVHGTAETTVQTLGDSTASADLTALNTTLPGYRSKLDSVAQALARTVNTVQADGYDRHGQAGAPMFSNGEGSTDPDGITAATIAVAGGFTADTVAASGTQSTDQDGKPIGNKNGDNALAAADLGEADDSPDSAYADLVGDLGRSSAAAQQQRTTQDSITSSVQSMKDSVSGVSFDEEMSHMLTYQHAYQASARVLTTLDSMLDTLINRTGVVGR